MEFDPDRLYLLVISGEDPNYLITSVINNETIKNQVKWRLT